LKVINVRLDTVVDNTVRQTLLRNTILGMFNCLDSLTVSHL